MSDEAEKNALTEREKELLEFQSAKLKFDLLVPMIPGLSEECIVLAKGFSAALSGLLGLHEDTIARQDRTGRIESPNSPPSNEEELISSDDELDELIVGVSLDMERERLSKTLEKASILLRDYLETAPHHSLSSPQQKLAVMLNDMNNAAIEIGIVLPEGFVSTVKIAMGIANSKSNGL